MNGIFKRVWNGCRGSFNLELALVISLLILVCVGTLTFMATGIDGRYNEAGVAVSGGASGGALVPASVQYTTPAGGTSTISWNPVDGATVYRVTQASDAVMSQNLVTLSDSITETDYQVSGLTSGTTGYYTVQAGNGTDWWGPSQVIRISVPYKYVVVGRSTTDGTTGTATIKDFAMSDDGVTWTDPGSVIFADDGATKGKATDVIWVEDHFVAIGMGLDQNGTYNPAVAISYDGFHWTVSASDVPKTNPRLAYSSSEHQLLAIGEAYNGSPSISTSNDGGLTWTGRGNPFSGSMGTRATWDQYNNQWVVVGVGATSTDNTVFTSPDGITWTGRGNPLSLTTYKAVAVGNILVGGVPTARIVVSGNASAAAPRFAYSDNGGNSWTSSDAVPFFYTSSVGASDMAWNGTNFMAVSDRSSSPQVAIIPNGTSTGMYYPSAPSMPPFFGITTSTASAKDVEWDTSTSKWVVAGTWSYNSTSGRGVCFYDQAGDSWTTTQLFNFLCLGSAIAE